MSFKHETKFHQAVGQEAVFNESPGVTVCEAHQDTIKNLFEAISTRMTRTQTAWTIGVLASVAIFYGVTLWTTVDARCGEAAARIDAIKNQVTIAEVKLQYIEDAVRELKVGQKETLARLDDLRKGMQRLNSNP